MAGNDEYPLRTIYFYLTPECNLACRHCWIAPRFQNVTNGDGLPSPARSSGRSSTRRMPLGLTGIEPDGGEPLLHPDIMEILAMAREHDLAVSVETNGTLVTPALAEDLSRCNDISVSVSLDGVDAATHEWVRGVKGSFDAALEGIRILVAAGIRPQVIMSLFRRNVEQIAPLVTMARRDGGRLGEVQHHPTMRPGRTCLRGRGGAGARGPDTDRRVGRRDARPRACDTAVLLNAACVQTHGLPLRRRRVRVRPAAASGRSSGYSGTAPTRSAGSARSSPRWSSETRPPTAWRRSGRTIPSSGRSAKGFHGGSRGSAGPA